MVLIACLGWYTSCHRALLGNQNPNSVCACCKDAYFGAGFISINGTSTLFVERDPYDFDSVVWGERPDGHFCDFQAPTAGSDGWGVSGLRLRIDSKAIAWCCPYWLMGLFWYGVLGQSPTRFRIADSMLMTLVVAVYFTLTTWRAVLPLLLVANLLTAIAITSCLLRSIRRPWFARVATARVSEAV